MAKSILITGCNGGIGRSVCNKFIKLNWKVYGTDIQKETDQNIKYICADLTKPASANDIMNEIKELDGIVNVAAYQICKPFWETDVEEWDSIYNCNVRAVFLLAKAGLNKLKTSKGFIINIGSVHSLATSDKICAYGSSKSAIVGLTRNLAIECGKFGIRVNCISPGAIDTQMLRNGLRRGHVGDEKDDQVLIDRLGEKHTLGRVGKPEEIAELVYYLSDNAKSGFITGSNMIIDGGATIKLSTE